MSFNKELYWRNRKAGKRGQGEVPSQQLSGDELEANKKRQGQGQHLAQIGSKLVRTNRAVFRNIMMPWRDGDA